MTAAIRPRRTSANAVYPTPPNQRHGVKRITTRVRGLAPWNPRPQSRELLALVQQVLVEYLKYLPLTIRQIFYRLVGAHGYDKTERAYKNLGEMLNRARRAGMVPWEVIRDDGITRNQPDVWDGPRQLIHSFVGAAQEFRLDRQSGQEHRLIFAIEAAGMVPQVARLADPLGITVVSGGGFDSTSSKYEFAGDLGEWPVCEVLHIGDYDVSGVHVFSSLAEDVRAFVADRGFDGEVEFTRLIVTREQIDRFGLQTAPPKATDRRSFDDIETVQAESLPPDTFAQIITDALNARIDKVALDEVLAREQHIRERLGDRLDHLLDLNWDDNTDGEAQQ